MKPLITVIVPVYNVADYLPRCLHSLAVQTFPHFCVLAVDDGSTDNSLQILESFAKTHPWLSVLCKENGGLSSARNAGLALANTEYIAFLDGDDFYHPAFLQTLYRAAKKTGSDIAACFPAYYYEHNGRFVRHPFRCGGVLSREEAITKLLEDLQLQSYAWNKLYRRSLFGAGDIQYPPMHFEDMATTLRLFLRANRVAVVNRCLYGYVQRKTSILKTPDPHKINDFIRGAASMRVALELSGQYPKFAKAYLALTAKTHVYCSYYLLKYSLTHKEMALYPLRQAQITRGLAYFASSAFHPTQWLLHHPETLPPMVTE